MTDDKDNHDAEDIDCLQAIGLLYEYLDGQLHNKIEKDQFEHHLQHCRHCYSRAEMEKELNKRLKSSAKGEVPGDLKNRLDDILGDF